MKKRIISWILLLGMVLSMLPATAFATDEDQMMETGSETVPIEPTEGDTTVTVNALTVGGVDALAQNTGDGWYFDPAANTLHLTGAYYDGEAEAAIYAEGDLTIVVAEGTENTFNGVDNGILTMGNLTITGSGKLRATASVAYNSGGAYGAIAIAATEKLCIFGANVTADADMVGIGSSGTMEIVDSTVEALGARNGLYSSGDLRISGSAVEAHATSVQADNKWDFRGYFLMGICAQEGDLLIEDGSSVNVSADQFGLYAENTTIQNSDLCVTATLTAIGTAQKLTINGESNVQLHATLTEEQHEEYGDQATAFFCNEVEIDENLTIVGGVIGDSLVQGGAKSIVDSEGKDVTKVSIVPAIISGTCGENLTWTLDDEGTLTISGEGAMYHYHYNNATAPWTDYQDQILTVVIEAGVTSIGDCAFYECENLTSIEIPASVTSMGNYVFYGCSNLKSIDIPAGVTSIGDYAFHGCRSLTSIAIPAGITSIAAGMVSTCSSLTSLDIPAGVKSIGDDAFAGCSSLTSIDIPEGVTVIGNYVFHGCTNLTSLDIPAGVTHIGNAAFRDCSSLTSIEIPAGVTAIGSNAFYSCVSLKTVTFKGNAPGIASNAFLGTTTTAYYPADNTTWTEEVKQNYGGTITWIAETTAGFEDVVPGAYYEIPVQWAVEKGITSGVDENHFAPDNACTRAQIVTFLWRAAGSPEPASMNNPFVDVAADSYYYKAVLWAVEKGITSGNDATHFAPDAPCNRGQVVTFLWSFRGRPTPSGNNIFTDVAPGAYYYNPVLWAVENGITSGMGDGTFGANAACNRGQIVTFLYKAVG